MFLSFILDIQSVNSFLICLHAVVVILVKLAHIFHFQAAISTVAKLQERDMQ